MSFPEVEENLVQSFRVLASGRAHADVRELCGVSIASLGVTFQMFNAAFLNSPVAGPAAMRERLETARQHFEARNMPWSFWVCEDWLAPAARRRLSRSCAGFGLRLASELPGMIAEKIGPASGKLPRLEMRRAESLRELEDFRAIGSACFHVPRGWFSEVFDERTDERREFVCWVGYESGVPVATAATVTARGTAGLYNVATLPEYRERGYGEAITREALGRALTASPASRVVLQATALGFRIYERMGFRSVTRILVYNSSR